MVSIGYFSTDWVQEPVIDEEQTRLTGQQVAVPGQKRLSHGGTFLARGSMPGLELNNHGYDNHLAWRFRSAPDGHIQTLDVHGEWRDPEIFYSQRWMHQDGPDQIRRARATGQICIADLDDDFWALGKTNIAYHTTDPKTNPTFNRAHYWKVLEACDAITVSTDALRRRVARLGVPTFVLRNAIDLRMWQQNDPGTDGYFSWIGGLQWRSHDLDQLRCIGLADFLEYHGEKLYHGGDSQVAGVKKVWDVIGVDPTKTQCLAAPIVPIWQYPQLWQPVNVSMIPLERCAFNEAKCIDIGDRVLTPNGPVQAGDVVVGDEVWGPSGWASVEAVEYQVPQRPGVEIRTWCGRVLKVTKDHRVFVKGGWTLAGDIAVGDHLTVLPGAAPTTSKYVLANWPADSRVSRIYATTTAFLSAESGPRVSIDERWGRFLGLLIGDGCIAKGQSTAVTISVDGQDADLIELIMTDLQAFGLQPTTQRVKTWGGQPLRRRSVGTASANFTRFLTGLGIARRHDGNVCNSQPAKILRIPECIWQSPHSVQAAFLSGLYEADGTVNRPNVSFTTKCEELARDVQLMLSMFGISVSIRERWNKSKADSDQRFQNFQVNMGRHGADIFAREIGFLSKRKQDKLSTVTSKPHSNAYRIPNWQDEVVTITPVLLDTVDIQVQGGELSVEGLHVHNSWLKSLESCAVGVPYIVSAKFPEQELLISEGTAGRQARNDKPMQWQNHLTDLLDPDLRSEEGRINRAVAEEHDIRKQWVHWDAAYQEIVRNSA